MRFTISQFLQSTFWLSAALTTLSFFYLRAEPRLLTRNWEVAAEIFAWLGIGVETGLHSEFSPGIKESGCSSASWLGRSAW